jgi:hypothetical protein
VSSAEKQKTSAGEVMMAGSVDGLPAVNTLPVDAGMRRGKKVSVNPATLIFDPVQFQRHSFVESSDRCKLFFLVGSLPGCIEGLNPHVRMISLFVTIQRWLCFFFRLFQSEVPIGAGPAFAIFDKTVNFHGAVEICISVSVQVEYGNGEYYPFSGIVVGVSQERFEMGPDHGRAARWSKCD